MAECGGCVKLVPEDVLIDVGLLREVFGTWKYRSSMVCRTFFTASTKEDAIAMASRTYHETPPEQLLTREQRDAAADAAEYAAMHLRYGHMTLQQLRARYAEDEVVKAQLQRAGRREMLPRGGRSTRAAVANEGARDTAEEMMRMRRYIERRSAGSAYV